MSPEMIRAVQTKSELGAYAAANLANAYDLFKEFWEVAMAATPVASVPDGWKHDCAGVLQNDVELWVDSCPHCGKPRPATPTPAEAPAVRPPDDIAVDAFATEMKAKMAKQRAKGYGGWESKTECPPGTLQKYLAEHIIKGDPVDVGNFAMMLWHRGEKTTPEAPAVQKANHEQP